MSVGMNVFTPFSIVCDANNAMNKNCCKEENKIGVVSFETSGGASTDSTATTNRLTKDGCMVLIDIQGLTVENNSDVAVLPIGFRPSTDQYVYAAIGSNPSLAILVDSATGHIPLSDGENAYDYIYGVISLC